MSQALGILLEVFGGPAAVAGLVSLAIALAGTRILLPSLQPWALPAALAFGFFAGYVCLPRTVAPILPEHSWHWLPYVAMSAAAAGIVMTGENRFRKSFSILIAVSLTLAIAGLVTPRWPILGLNWPVSIAWLSIYLVALSLPLLLLPDRMASPLLLAIMSASAAILALAIAAMVSIRLAQPAGIAAVALAGCWIASVWHQKPQPAAICGLVFVFATLVGGTAFVSAVEPDPPILWLLIFPIIPLAIWLKSAVSAAG